MINVLAILFFLFHPPQESAKAATKARTAFSARMDAIEKKLDSLEVIIDSIQKAKHGKRVKKG